MADLGNAWKFRAREVIDPTDYDLVFFLDADCLILRNLDHLFGGDDWDILYQPEPGRSIQDGVFSGYLTDEEMSTLTRDGANAGTWAVKSSIYEQVMETWDRIMASEAREKRWRDQTAWNRLLLDAERYGWRAKPFPALEVQFPLHLNRDWIRYRKAAIIHCMGVGNLKKIEFMFGMYMQRFFHDPTGLMMNILEM